MEENKNQQPQTVDDATRRLEEPLVAEEIRADEAAMAAAGLDHPEEVQTERMLDEARELTQEQTPFRDEEYTQTFGEGEGLEQAFEAPEQEEPEEEEELPKRRPCNRTGPGLLGIPHILATVAWLAIVVMIGVSMGRLIWVCVEDVLAFGRVEREVEITIEDSDTIKDIAQKLENSGLIRYAGLFEVYAQLSDAREDISSGTFKLNTIYDYHALVNCMTTYSSSREVVTVMIPEGYTCERMFQLLEDKGVCKAEKLAEYAAGGELDEYWFLEGVERGSANCLEGFLFPDTYDFYVDDTPERVLEKLLDNFDRRFSDEMVAQMDVLNDRLAAMMRESGYGDEYISDNLFTVQEVVTVASLIEKETANRTESFTISSVIYNRLTNQAQWPYLNIDAALLYALGHKEALTYEDLQADTPYNTYTHRGLVPGPICNPGLNSLSAALDPDDTEYHYYALNPATGSHKFSKTTAEHEQFLNSLGG